MKTLKFKFDLSSKVSIYVPSTVNVSESVDNKAQVIEVIKRLSTMFGGATASEAMGGWVCATGEVVTEQITIVYSFCSDAQLQERFDDVLAICNELKQSMSQEAITLEINGQVQFV